MSFLRTRSASRKLEEWRDASLAAQADVVHVSTNPGDTPETARYYWHTALGELIGHMVHYGESSFATVFTEGGPLEEAADLDFSTRDVIVQAAEQVLEERRIDSEGGVYYIGRMSLRNARSFAENAQEDLERRAVTDSRA